MASTTAIRGIQISLLLSVCVAANAAAGQRQAPAGTVDLGDAWRPAATLDTADARNGFAVDVAFDVLRRAAARGGVLRLPLTAGMSVRFTIQWSQADATQTAAAGPLVDAEGEASLTLVGDSLAGRVVVGDRLFLVRRLRGSSAHVVAELDQASLPPESAPLVPPVTAASPRAERDAVGDSNAFVDLMVLYTPASRAAIGGTSAMVAELTAALNSANLALANAGVTHRFRLVHQAEVAYAETNDIRATLNALTFGADGQLDNVPALRDQYQADVVTLFSTDRDACGVGWLMGPNDINTAFAPWAYNVVNWTCANANLTMAHEIGHNMGLHHDRPWVTGPGAPAFPYAYGYTVNGLARDVMAYDFSCNLGCPRRPIYSTPLFNFPGTAVPAGTANEDTARALEGTSTTVANFRQSLCTFVISPANATFAPGGGSGSVPVNFAGSSCSWTATSSNTAFVTVTSGATGSGSGTVTYVVAPNNGPASRTATLTIGEQMLPIFQAGRNNLGDVDGDGRAEIATYRPSEGSWQVLTSATDFTAGDGYSWGVSTDLPVAGDFDADGRNDLVVYRPATGQWFVLQSSTNFTTSETYQWGAAGDKPVPADYDGDGRTDFATYRPSTGSWSVLPSSTGYTGGFSHEWGVNTDMPLPGDYDGDLRADIAVYRPVTGQWFILTSGSSYTSSITYQWGAPGDIPVPANYDGDMRTDIAFYRPSTGSWHLLRSSTGFTSGSSYTWGITTDTPVPADYDGDGRSDLAVFRSSTAHWFILTSTSNFSTGMTYQWGTPEDVPVQRRLPGSNHLGDVDGDGRAEITAYRPSDGGWRVLRSDTNFTAGATYSWGTGTDLPVSGDFDGDGRSDVVVYRPATGQWFVLQSATNFSTSATYQWGSAGDKPVPADYDGDGRTDFGVYRPSTGGWYALTSRSGYTSGFSYSWGVSTDQPVPGDYDGDARADLVVYRPGSGQWFILTSSSNYTSSLTYSFGGASDIPVSADYDGDMRTDVAIYRPSTGMWAYLMSSSGFTVAGIYTWGVSTDTPVPADYDGDNRTDLAVFRSSTAQWFILTSTSNFSTWTTHQWGSAGDTPVLRRQ